MKNKLLKLIFNKEERGVAALFVVAIIGATALIMAFSASWFGIVDLDTGYLAKNGEEAASLADGCLENALQRLRFDVNYSGEILNFGEKSCIISVISNGNQRSITVNASLENFHQKLTANISLDSNNITLNGWQEND